MNDINVKISKEKINILRKLYPAQSDKEILESCVDYVINDQPDSINQLVEELNIDLD